MERSVIFIDVDGTIYDPKLEKVPDTVIEAIKKTRKNGHLVFLATGRTSSFLHKQLYPDLFDGYVLSHGNQLEFQGENLYSKYIPEDILKELIKKFQEDETEFCIFSKDHGYVNDFNSKLYDFYTTQLIDSDKFIQYNDKVDLDKIYKLECWGSGKENWDEYFKTFDLLKFEKDPVSLRFDVNLKTATKAAGIEKLLELTNLNSLPSYCFGDALNDVEMFELVDYPIAMDNGNSIIKEMAWAVCPSVLQAGVGQFLNSLFNSKKFKVG